MVDLTCRTEERRRLVRRDQRFNGLDFLEVSDDQRTLTVRFLDKAPADLVPANIVIIGGRRVTGIKVTGIDVCGSEDPELDDCLSVTVDRPGDFSCYRLCVVDLDDDGHPTDRPRHDFDPRYACLDFSFKASCPTELDCVAAPCPPETFTEPDLNYLAKDYASFRQLVLDRLALLVPDWRERHAPDLGVALVELLAYVGDHLSYQQDAVATEAYLDTARLRVSVRRHARLVDYHMHEGCNARAWVSIEAGANHELPAGAGFVTSLEGLFPVTPGPVLQAARLERVPADAYEWFEPVRPSPITVRAAHSRIALHTWGDTECCLPAGATRATLVDGYRTAGEYEEPTRLLNLSPGDYLLLEEVVGPRTGVIADADPTHRQVVRLTHVEPGTDALLDQPVVEVTWAADDALTFPLCISAETDPPGCAVTLDVSVARANVVLVDHGRTVDVGLPGVATLAAYHPCADGCPDEPVLVPATYRPALPGVPLTFRAPIGRRVPARRAVQQHPRHAGPALDLRSTSPGRPGPEQSWAPRLDLLASGSDDRHLVVEVDDDGIAHLRFGDGVLGRAPSAGDAFRAVFRVGNGPAGNVGPESIAHLVSSEVLDGIGLTVRNPLAASGGTAAEPVPVVKAFAPTAFRRDRQRAVTADDYAELARRDAPEAVQRAAAELQWTGSWYEVVVAVDALGRVEADDALLQRVRRGLEPYRRIAHDVRVVPAVTVALHVRLYVCVTAGHRRADVHAALLDRLGSRVRADGGLGLFHPDRLTFGQSVHVSRLVATAATVTGVDNVIVTDLRRYGEADEQAVARGELRLRAHEVARLDNDPTFPGHGVLEIEMGGGR